MRWNDKKVVSVISNYDMLEPLGKVMRYDRNKEKRIYVSQSKLIRCSNSGIGGVDRHDWMLGHYDVAIGGKQRKNFFTGVSLHGCWA